MQRNKNQSTRCRKRAFDSFPPLSLEFCPEKFNDVLNEHVKVEDLLNQPKDHIVLAKDLQTVFPVSRSQITEKTNPGGWIGQYYFHNKKTIGRYDTKGVSFSVAYGERLVLLSSETGGVESILSTIVGQDLPVAGVVFVD